MSFMGRVCVIGAGKAGLCALKNALQQNFNAISYEKSKYIGGTWVYDENIGDNENEVHSSLYDGLRTNLPKEIMGYPDFPYPQDETISFLNANDVLNYLKSYVKQFHLRENIKFRHEVIRVMPVEDKWEVYVHDIDRNKILIEFFDFIFVCNGNFSTPIYPEIDGMNIYAGKQLHSHIYRKAIDFKDQIVLVIGCGASGIDIVNQLDYVCKQVLFSNHLIPPPNTDGMTNVIQKPDVKHFTKDGVEFITGEYQKIDCVIFCTGYKYTFPFLSSACDVYVNNNSVQPLYKHCLSIKHPTMAFIGLPSRIIAAQLFDIQIRFALKFYTKKKSLPSREEMLKDLENDRMERRAKGLIDRNFHLLGLNQFDYYNDLVDVAEIENVKPAIEKIMRYCGGKFLTEPRTYRQKRFRIIDDENFEFY